MKKLARYGIALFIFFVLIFIFLSYISPLKQFSFVSFKNSSDPLSILYFNPVNIYSECNGEQQSAFVMLETNGNEVSGAQIELSFDPDYLYNVTLIPSGKNLFGDRKDFTINLMEARENFGRASLAIEENSSNREVSGDLEIAALSFNVYSFSDRILNVNFLNKSTVLSRRNEKSLLSETTPLLIHCSKKS